MVENSDLFFVGTVVLKTAVLRYNLRPYQPHRLTTDILVRVETMIKGEPNHGDKYLVFTVRTNKKKVTLPETFVTRLKTSAQKNN